MTAITEDIATETVAVTESPSVNGAVVGGAAPESEPADVTETPVSDASVIKIVKGSPTDVEIAALVSVLVAAASAGSAPAETALPETWGSPVQFHRTRAPFSPYAYLNPAMRHA